MINGLGLCPPPRSLSEWDKQSSSSMSELSVACLQDRITQMEETHYSTSEELQATLQELTDLQDQCTDLHVMNEQLESDKAVLLESLCSQTEKLEDCRSKMVKLRQLLLEQYESEEKIAVLSPTERETNLVELLKGCHNEQQELTLKKEELNLSISQLKEKICRLEEESVVISNKNR